MGKLVVTERVTLDGVAQAPGGPDDDREGGFVHGGWQAPLSDEDAGGAIFEKVSTMEALLLGRKTYDLLASYWPSAPDEIPFKGVLNRVTKYVASRTLAEPLAWSGSSVVSGDLGAAVALMKEHHDEVHVIGSLDLTQSLLRLDLVDRLNLWVYPLLLGTGKKLFADGTAPRALRLTDSRTYANGTLQITYETAGDPTDGVIGE
jgi:dihydrofolate reductase